MTQVQRAAVRELLELPSDSSGAFRLYKKIFTLSGIRRTLHLPTIPYSQFLSSDCWLAGGAVLRWLSQEGMTKDTTKGDFDFFFPSLTALNTTARAMLDQGFQLRGYVSFSQNVWEYLRQAVHEDRGSGIWDEAGDLAPINHELIERLRLKSLEFRSPENDTLQLVAFFLPTPFATIMQFDISICQLAVDDQHLSFGSWTWSDLLHNRFRAQDPRWPDGTFWRMFKYARRGFWPYPSTVLKVSYLALSRLGRYLFNSAGNPSVKG